MDVEKNTYNIQEVGLAKALVRKGNVCDIVFWTDKDEKEVAIPVDDRGKVTVFYKHGKTALKNTVYSGCDELFAQYDVLQTAEYNQMQSWILAKKYPEKHIVYSIVPQLNNKVEVILVNDGSTDNSKDIICDYIDHYNQFRLYDKPNEGVSAARNIGLKVASGKYVTFLDSDDYVEPDYMRKIIENIHKMEQDELDLMIFGFYRKVGENCRVNLPDAKGNIIKEIFTQKYNAPWNKIFKKSLIDAYELEFPVSMKTSEDFLFLLDYVQNTCKIGVADECCIYNYCDNPCGAVNNTKEQYLIDTIKIYHKIQAMMKNHSISYINEIENSIMERYYYIVYNLLRMGDNKKELRSILYTLNFDLKQMLNLDRKNKLKRFLVEHQLFSIIERSIKR